MIINHAHKFCFFAIPRTGSQAISKALVQQLNSERYLRMHCTFDEFITASPKAYHSYFKFAAVRNPLDSVVSAYFKKKNDHNGRFSRGTFKNGRAIGSRALEEYRYIVKNNADFSAYFKKFYLTKYSKPHHEKTIAEADSVVRFENLVPDTNQILSKLGLPTITIPKVNQTAGKSNNFSSYYSPEIIPQAIEVFSPIMEKWGYDFPESW